MVVPTATTCLHLLNSLFLRTTPSPGQLEEAILGDYLDPRRQSHGRGAALAPIPKGFGSARLWRVGCTRGCDYWISELGSKDRPSGNRGESAAVPVGAGLPTAGACTRADFLEILQVGFLAGMGDQSSFCFVPDRNLRLAGILLALVTSGYQPLRVSKGFFAQGWSHVPSLKPRAHSTS